MPTAFQVACLGLILGALIVGAVNAAQVRHWRVLYIFLFVAEGWTCLFVANFAATVPHVTTVVLLVIIVLLLLATGVGWVVHGRFCRQ
jgi:hypothetical protein